MNPFISKGGFESALEAALGRSRSGHGLLWDLRRIPSDALERAVRTGSISHVTGSVEYQRSLQRANLRLRAVHEQLIRDTAQQALSEIGSTMDPADLDDLVDRLARRQTGRLLRAVDQGTRRNLRRVIRNGRRRYTRMPSSLDEIVKDARPQLGISYKTGSNIQNRVRAMRSAGIPESRLSLYTRSRQRSALSVRAKAGARHGLSVSVNETRHEIFDIISSSPGVVMSKRWRHQNDDRVRASHRLQAAVGWIPFDDEYAVFGVQHPPAPVFGCRCYEEVRVARRLGGVGGAS